MLSLIFGFSTVKPKDGIVVRAQHSACRVNASVCKALRTAEPTNLPKFKAHFELRQVVFSTSTCLIARSCCCVTGCLLLKSSFCQIKWPVSRPFNKTPNLFVYFKAWCECRSWLRLQPSSTWRSRSVSWPQATKTPGRCLKSWRKTKSFLLSLTARTAWPRSSWSRYVRRLQSISSALGALEFPSHWQHGVSNISIVFRGDDRFKFEHVTPAVKLLSSSSHLDLFFAIAARKSNKSPVCSWITFLCWVGCSFHLWGRCGIIYSL